MKPVQAPRFDKTRLVMVYPFDLRAHSQIMARARAQIAFFRAHGYDAVGVFPDRNHTSEEIPPEFLPLTSRAPRRLRPFGDALALHRLLRTVAPDVLVVRYSFASPSLHSLAKRLPVILEIHLDDTHELPPNRLVQLIWRTSNRIYRDRTLRNAAGAMFVSRQIAELDAFAMIPGPRAVVTNGVPIPAIPLPVPNNDAPVVGYSVGYDAPWQGLDRLNKLAEMIPEFEFWLLCSDVTVAEALPPGSRVRVIVSASHEEYQRRLAEVDVMLGTLALERKSMSMSSSLKVRESVSLGIPTALFSVDEDLHGVQDDTVATLPAAWDNLDAMATAFRAFVGQAVSKRVPDSIRRSVDIQDKARSYAGLIERVLETPSAW